MKLVWSPETALKAYLDTIKSCEVLNESSVAELISAMAAGWNAQLIVETWCGGTIKTSVGLEIARIHTGGRHVCLVPDKESRILYKEGMEKSGVSPGEIVVVGGDNEAGMEGLEGIDFLVVDSSRGNNFERILRVAKLGKRGAVLICKNASCRRSSESGGFRWSSVVGGESRIVRSVQLPVGKGLDIAHVGATLEGRRSALGKPGGGSRWINYFDHHSGEEYVFRR